MGDKICDEVPYGAGTRQQEEVHCRQNRILRKTFIAVAEGEISDIIAHESWSSRVNVIVEILFSNSFFSDPNTATTKCNTQ